MAHDVPTRRHFLKLSAGVPAALALGAPVAAWARTRPLPPTPACVDPAEPTPRQTAGPFFKPDSPQRTSLLEAGIGGTTIVLAGRVLATDCTPVAGALVDFWHADDRGVYDNDGFRLRGHQFTDAEGRYRLETIVPGNYWTRTRHFHVNVQAPGRPVLTTQLYFPGEPKNQRDFLFNPDLVVAVHDVAAGRAAAFDFVLDRGARGSR